MKKLILLTALLLTVFASAQIDVTPTEGLIIAPKPLAELNAIGTKPSGLIVNSGQTLLWWNGSEYIDILAGSGGGGSDDQQLSLSGNDLTLEDGGSVDLSPFALDDQTFAEVLAEGNVSGSDIDMANNNINDVGTLNWESDSGKKMTFGYTGDVFELAPFAGQGFNYTHSTDRWGIGNLDFQGNLSIEKSSETGREDIFTAMVDDAPNDVFGISNGTVTNNLFLPVFYGFSRNGNQALLFRGLGLAADDNVSSKPYLEFLAGNTLVPDPNNKPFTAPQNRTLFSWGTVNDTHYMEIEAGGTVKISSLAGNGTGLVGVDNNGNLSYSSSGGGSGITDGDKGDITVTNSGSTFTIDDNSINTNKLADGGVNGSVDIQDMSITVGKLANNSVTYSAMADNSVGTEEIRSKSINGTADIQDGSIVTSNISPQGSDGQVLTRVGTIVQWADPIGSSTASEITFDNSATGNSATDVQAAIDEMVAATKPKGVTVADGYDIQASDFTDQNTVTLNYAGSDDIEINLDDVAQEGQALNIWTDGIGNINVVLADGVAGTSFTTVDSSNPLTLVKKFNGFGYRPVGSWELYVPITAIEAAAPLYDFDANSLSIGNSVASIVNAGSGTADAIQATGGNQPTVVDEGGKNAIKFDGVDDYLTLGTPSDLDFTIGTDDFTIIIVRGSDSGSGGNTNIFGDRSGSDRNFNIGQTSTTSFITLIGNSSQFFDVGVSEVNRVIYEVSVEASLIDTYVDGVADEVDYSVGSDQPLQEVRIGLRPDGTAPYGGTVRRVLVFNRVLTPSERADITSELESEN